MALATVVAGPYTSTYNAADTGQTEDGFKLRQTVNKQLVKSDSYGESVIDAVYRGGDCFLMWTGIEYSDAIGVGWPYGALGVMGQAGRMDMGSSIAAASVLTAVAGTTAAATPATLTASNSLVDENLNLELFFASKARFLPITMRLYPYTSTGTRWFTTT